MDDTYLHTLFASHKPQIAPALVHTWRIRVSGRDHERGGGRRWDKYRVDKRGGGTEKAGVALSCPWWYPQRQTSEHLLARYDLGLRPPERGLERRVKSRPRDDGVSSM